MDTNQSNSLQEEINAIKAIKFIHLSGGTPLSRHWQKRMQKQGLALSYFSRLKEIHISDLRSRRLGIKTVPDSRILALAVKFHNLGYRPHKLVKKISDELLKKNHIVWDESNIRKARRRLKESGKWPG